ncbi:MAG: hypothetical protein Q4E88_02630 [Coriobacteriia bacterium]|nr:hypothetical protein [Coriobacteriia bacterium]
MEDKFSRRIQKTINIFCWVPLLLGTVGYMIEGNDFLHSLYSTICLYFMNPINSDENLLIILTKFLTVIVAGNIILTILFAALSVTSHFITNRFKDSTAIYTDNEFGSIILDKFKHSYIVKIDDTSKKPHRFSSKGAKRHIFVFDNDNKCINEFKRYESYLTDKNVYLLLNNVDSFLIHSQTESSIKRNCKLQVVNFQELLARDFWCTRIKEIFEDRNKNFKKLGDENKKYNIAICGYGSIGNAILRYAILNNLYDVNQNFVYHVWGCSLYKKKFIYNVFNKSKDIGSKDEAFVYDDDYLECVDKLMDMDIVICTEEQNSLELVKRMLFLRKQNKLPRIYYYSKSDNSFSDIYVDENIKPFGRPDSILNEHTVIDDSLYKCAKYISYDYHSYHEWETKKKESNRDMPPYQKYIENMINENNLDKHIIDHWEGVGEEDKKDRAFSQGSDIARADHLLIEKTIRNKKNIIDDMDNPSNATKELWALEHIRWCRYLILNGYTYGEKDPANKTHNCLIEFSKLSKNYQRLDGYQSKCIESMIDKEVCKKMKYYNLL